MNIKQAILTALYCPHMMHERIPQSVFRPVPPPAERPPQPLPDYAEASNGQLRLAYAGEMTRLLTADMSHFLLKALVLANQLYAVLYHGEHIEIDWDPDVTGIRPDLDEKERSATERLRAIFREQKLRRSVRQNLRNR